jgi:hypothetical protein
VCTFGLGWAMAIDAIALVAYSFGLLKRLVLRQVDSVVPYFVRDLLGNSVLRPVNRQLSGVKSPDFSRMVQARADRCSRVSPVDRGNGGPADGDGAE